METVKIENTKQAAELFSAAMNVQTQARFKAVDVAAATLIYGVIGLGKVKGVTKDNIIKTLRDMAGCIDKDADGATRYNKDMYAVLSLAAKAAHKFTTIFGHANLAKMEFSDILATIEGWRSKENIRNMGDYNTAILGGNKAANGSEKKTLGERVIADLTNKSDELADDELAEIIKLASAIMASRNSAKEKAAKVKAAKVKAA